MKFSLSFRPQSLFLSAVFVAFLLDCFIFKSGFYNRYLNPASAAGAYQAKFRIGEAEERTSTRLVAVLGDSRITEGFSSRLFELIASPSRLKAVNLAIPGSSPRVWFYLLRDLDPGRNAFRLIVIPVDSYSEFDPRSNVVNRREDLVYLAPFQLNLHAAELIGTFSSPSVWGEIIAATLFRVSALKADLRNFLFAPLERLSAIKAHERFFKDSERTYTGNPDSLQSLLERANTVAQSDNDSIILKRVAEAEKPCVEPSTNELYAYSKYWLERIIALYSQSNTKILIIRIPRSPVRRTGVEASAVPVLLTLGDFTKVFVSPEDAFTDLETKSNFFDEMHLNAVGRELFTRKLSSFIIALDQDTVLPNRAAHDARSRSNRLIKTNW